MSRAADPWDHPDRVVDEALHASRRGSAWAAAAPKGMVVGHTPSKRAVQESWVSGLRDLASSSGRGAVRARSPARRAAPSASKQGAEGRLVVETRVRADSPARAPRQASPGAPPGSRRKPRLVEVVDPNGTSATDRMPRAEWQVPSFKVCARMP